MKIISTNIKDCFIIENSIYKDSRGLFIETYQKEKFDEKLGLSINFVQDNFSLSKKVFCEVCIFKKNFLKQSLLKS